MAHNVLMPKAGQTMEEGTLVQWLKKEGDAVAAGDPIMVIQTDKADLEVEAQASGVLRKILVHEGQVVPVLSVVAVIAAADEEIDAEALGAAAPRAAAPPAPAPEAPSTTPAPVRATPAARKVAEALGVDLGTVKGTGVSARIMKADVCAAAPARTAASPCARALARAHGVDLASLTPSGPEGRIIKRDVEARIAAAPAAAPPSGEGTRVVELTGMRKAIAGALQFSKQQAPHFYATLEVDMTRALAFKDYLRQTGRKATVNDLVLRAAVAALLRHPQVNCRIEGDRVTYFSQVNLGVAVGLEEGLVVPVILNAGALGLDALAEEARRIAAAAREGKLIGMGRGTFTVTNLGMFGVESFAAIINPPEAGILAVGAARDAVAVKDRTFTLTKSMKLTASVDHRVVDGILAAKFLNSVKEFLENPENLSA
ncbi:MAG TPA: dihydrolipoamide acetyltransferase family protein [Planctomycetota bacterium]|jgi:pyruvate dehydrogenase E2 component (dihydrolipoamide acetyltransferase)|nr:2-oxo acid dehydrogenase subunit E2 [Planctomycetota bacterium]OQC20045.1 MAG: Dihydrolipoyllysine-residue acetyltransferase component of pyruvate dehydrogenase complex [Planctomycetes bacterium ADurb.Bin069]HNR98702.1 dihydrolipoamide acetyltransferase family protein [Planctomycetota bacterium]HNU25082.1 dihydrolipoamide acetyltransferase family protein [Planctomycetota bacterium]HOE28434.1 dihydrolipoamide acetyltransferase family protein [Planctomycetota bacterium]